MVSEFRDATHPAGGPLRTTANALLKELTSIGRRVPLRRGFAEGRSPCRRRDAGTPDETRDALRLERAVRDAGGTLVKSVTLEDDHVFSASRVRLAELLVGG